MFSLVRDWFGVWAIDRAGVESGKYRHKELRRLLDSGEVTPHTWVRHVWTRRFALLGEVLFANGHATPDEYEGWFPMPSSDTSPSRSGRMRI